LTARPDQADITMLGERRSRISTNSETRPNLSGANTLEVNHSEGPYADTVPDEQSSQFVSIDQD